MSISLGVIDADGNFGLGALDKHLEAQTAFSELANQLKRQFPYIDASFGQGRLDVSDYVLPLWKSSNAQLEAPILNQDIHALLEKADRTIVDNRIRSVVVAFLSCSEASGLDVVFSG